MEIRLYHTADWPAVKQLFYDTAYSINAQDYSPEQINAWAPAGDAKERMQKSLENNISYVAEQAGKIVGFANMTRDGYIDYIFTHKDYQGRGIASALFKKLEAEAQNVGIKKMSTHASITAKPFFEKQGFMVMQEQQVEIRGVKLTNYVMEKVIKG